jgi:hypothetical protein
MNILKIKKYIGESRWDGCVNCIIDINTISINSHEFFLS